MTSPFRHRSVRGGLRADRERIISALDLPPRLIATVDAHARLRGPYTAGGAIVRAVAEAALLSEPALAHRHDIEIRALVPELRAAVPVLREALAETIPPAERTRIYPRLRTRRLAHGVTDLLRDYLLRLGGGPRSLVIENMHRADLCDRELVAVLVRRLDPALLTIVASGADPDAGSDPASNGGPRPAPDATGRAPGGRGHAQSATARDPLDDALAAHAVLVLVPAQDPAASDPALDPAPGQGMSAVGTETAPRGAPPAGTDAASRPAGPAGGGDAASLAARYVRGDGVSDDPALLAAYAGLGAAARARLHDARADELAPGGESAARFGAIPYHRERGSDPAGGGVRALADAARHCFATGFHAAVTDLGARGRGLISREHDPASWWLFTSLAAGSLAALGRGVAAEALYDEARRASTDPAVHRMAAYETAMLYARHHDVTHRDPVAAQPWINEAIAFKRALPDAAGRAFHLAFGLNGLALVEMRTGNPDRALELVDEALELFDRHLPAGSHPLDRCSLLANRARLLTMKGALTAALACHDALVGLDPTYGEYHFERGNLLHLLGRDDDALAAYAEAERLSLPLPELHYNRADLLAARGEHDAALADLDRVLALDPDFLDAYVNRAGLLAARGDGASAWPDVNAGLARDPAIPTCCVSSGSLKPPAAGWPRPSPRSTRPSRPGPVCPRRGRAAPRSGLEVGDPDAAVADLSRALEQGEDSGLLFNRAVAHKAAGRLEAARNDAERSLTLHPGDPETVALLAEITP